MTIEIPKDSWSGSVQEITIGATADNGGTRKNVVTVGGENKLPFLNYEAETPNKQLIAL